MEVRDISVMDGRLVLVRAGSLPSPLSQSLSSLDHILAHHLAMTDQYLLLHLLPPLGTSGFGLATG